uniref:Receptor-type protein tyrosine kinase n=1 Tax=Monosiga ovata TaxID=81526 RepID=B3XVV6_9EUKA|nr:receptor-type protein tyrosine kinase [Monosiga ovata]
MASLLRLQAALALVLLCATQARAGQTTCLALANSNYGYCYVWPYTSSNQCPGNTGVNATSQSAKNVCSGYFCSCPDRNQCCMAPQTCVAGTSTGQTETCINPYAAVCQGSNGQYCNGDTLQINPLSSAYNFAQFGNPGYYLSNSRCLVRTSANPVCPPNYVSKYSPANSNLRNSVCYACIPNNCYAVSNIDATVCLQCSRINNVQYAQVSDGSCQPPPSLAGTLTWSNGTTFTSTYCSATAMVIATDWNMANTTVVNAISAAVHPSAKQALTTASPTLNASTTVTYLRISSNLDGVIGTFAISPALTGQVTTLRTGRTYVLEAKATDTNKLATSCSIQVIVRDLQPPTLTCAPVTIYTVSNGATSTFAWSRVVTSSSTGASGWDNVGITNSSCTGGPANNIFNFGSSYTITCTARDAASNIAACSYPVTVVDNVAPKITCPNPITANSTFNLSTAPAAWSLQTSDNVQVADSSCSSSSSSLFSIGVNNVTCTVTDSSSNAASCWFLVTVKDYQAPYILCPSGPAVLSADAASPSLTTTVGSLLSAVDNSELATRIVCTPGGYGIPYTFPYGSSLVSCQAWDAFNNTGTLSRCNFTLTVVDTTAPMFTNCSSATLYTPAGLNYSTLAKYYVAASDNINVTNISCTPSTDGARKFPVGETAVSCLAVDAAGNVNTGCSLTVTVVDNQPPIVACPLSQRNTSLSPITVSYITPTASDNVGLNSTSLIVQIGNAVGTYPTSAASYTFISIPTTVTFTYIATDTSGNTAQCTWNLILTLANATVDTTPPTITNCPSSVVPTNLLTPPSQTYSAYNTNASIATFTYYASADQPGLATVSWPNITSSDNQPGMIGYYLDLGAAPAKCIFSQKAGTSTTLCPGQYVIIYQAVDTSGNNAFCVFRMNVIDVVKPTWNRCPSNATYQTNCGSNSSTTTPTWPSGGITAKDNYAMATTYGACTSSPAGFCPAQGQILSSALYVGLYTFTYTVADYYNNYADPCVFTLNIHDNCAPTLSIPQNTFLQGYAEAGQSYGYVDNCPTVTATDNVAVTALTTSSAPVNSLNCTSQIPISTSWTQTVFTQVAVTAADAAGNTAGASIYINIVDFENPVITGCSSSGTDVVVPCAHDSSSARVFLPTVLATDNSGYVMLSNESSPAGYYNGSIFPYTGPDHTITLKFVAKDPSRNQDQCFFFVKVLDEQAPTLHGYPGNNQSFYSYNLTTDPGLSTAALTLPNITATDNVGVVAMGWSDIYTSGGNFNFSVGVTQLTFSASDDSLNVATFTVTVTVVDKEAPVFLNCPGNSSTLNTSYGLPTAPYTWPIVQAYDNVNQGRVFILELSDPYGYTYGSLFPVGVTKVTYTASDLAGNSAECLFYVHVVDNQAPVLNCPQFQEVYTPDEETAMAAVTWQNPQITDNYFWVNFARNTNPNLNYSVGLYNVTYWAWDAAGNNGSCSFSFSVLQTTATPAASSASSSTTTTAAAAGAGGGIFLIALVAVYLMVLARRKAKKRMSAASAGYAELMAMSDEFILERARAIQTALMSQRQLGAPQEINTTVIHPDRKFIPPPSDLAGLIAYIRDTCNKEIDRLMLEFGTELGSGEFGAVFEGLYTKNDEDDKQKVAIKMLRKATTDEDKGKFLKEAAIMAQFNHPNIVSLVGVCTQPESEPTLIVIEYCHLGSLHGYLQSPMVKDQLESLTMIRMALDVGSAMAYLAEAGFVHRDLAARNVLLDKTMTCRVADFGLSVDLASAEGDGNDEGAYAGQDGGKIPIRWSSIEAICFRQFSVASDVWSFGVLLWEIWSYAELPYKGWNNRKVTEQVNAGYRLEKPTSCPDEVYKIMVECWNKNVKRRITFPKINQALIQAWKDVCKDQMGGGEESGNLYDAGDQNDDDGPVKGAGTALYDNPDPSQERSGGGGGMALYDTGDEGPSPLYASGDIADGDGTLKRESSKAAVPMLQPMPSPSEPEKKNGSLKVIGPQHVGARVAVVNFGVGVLAFYGAHVKDGKPRCGVVLDDSNGLNNGTVGGHKYFECAPKHGVLVDPRSVMLATDPAAAEMVNPLYDAAPEPAVKPSGYLQIGEERT